MASHKSVGGGGGGRGTDWEIETVMSICTSVQKKYNFHAIRSVQTEEKCDPLKISLSIGVYRGI